MASIPSWVYILIKVAIQIGSPYLLGLVQKLIGNLPPELLQIIQDFINSLKNPFASNSTARKTAMFRLNEHRAGNTPDAGDTKKL